MTALTLEPADTIDWLHPQLAADFDVIDLFAAGGGWDEGSRVVDAIDHDKVLGIEWDLPACQTAIAAGHRRFIGDIALLQPRDFARCTIVGLIASPPCQGFSMAGDGGGRRDTPYILEAVEHIARGRKTVDEAIAWLRDVAEDPKSALVLEPLRWMLELGVEWTAWEQVPAVIVLWRAIAPILRSAGYKVWTGVVNSADYGVPQTRKRAILIASRVRHVDRPEPTHAQGGTDGDLFGDPLPDWISMATALGWGKTATSVRTSYGKPADVPGNGHHTLDPTERPAHTVTTKVGDWQVSVDESAGELVGFPRRLGSDPSDPDQTADAVIINGVEYRARDLTHTDQPSQTVTEKIRSWQRFPLESVELRAGDADHPERNTARRNLSEPAPTIAFGNNSAQWRWALAEAAVEGTPTDPSDVVYVNGTADHAARRSADQPAPTVLFGERLNSVDWQVAEGHPFFGLSVRVDPDLPPNVIEFRAPDGTVLDRVELADEAYDDSDADVVVSRGRFILTGGIAGDAVPRAVDQPAPTLSGAGAACWIRDVAQWIRADRLASQDTPKGQALGGRFDRRDPRGVLAHHQFTDHTGTWCLKECPRPDSECGELAVIQNDPGTTYCVFCRCSDSLHDADGACSGCQAGLLGGDRPHCRWEAQGEGWASRGWAEPAPTIVTTRRSFEGLLLGRQLPPGEGRNVGGKGWADRPDRLNNQSGSDYDLDEQVAQPASTLAGRDLVPFRGANANRFNDSTKSRNDGIRVTVSEAAILQSFRPDYPWQGSKTQQYQQVGNAVPPRLAAHVLAAATGSPTPSYKD